jgi:predicted DsbA family dithiol-disulfide isomerase
MRIEIWSDIVCPWCYIGRRRLERALARFDGAADVEIVHRSFELDPHAPSSGRVDLVEHLARKYGVPREQALAMTQRLTAAGAAEGIDLRFDLAVRGNTFDAHRLVHEAASVGSGDRMVERLMRAYFTEGLAVADREVLARLAGEVGLDAVAVGSMLATDRWAAEVRADEERATDLGVTGVPFFLIDGRFGVPGAQDPDTMLRVLERARTRATTG